MMKKRFGSYALIWAIALAAWVAVVFLVRPILPGFTIRYGARFWVVWAFILAAFLGNLVCAYFALRAESLQKLFYHLPLITVSRSALVALLLVGCALLLIPGCPAWIAAVVCVLISAFHAVAVVKASWAAEEVETIEEKVKTQTAFLRSLTADAESLLARAKGEEARAACKKVYEAVRYSDPMSNAALTRIESQITQKFGEFSNAVTNETDAVAILAEELVALIEDRNKKCKLLK